MPISPFQARPCCCHDAFIPPEPARNSNMHINRISTKKTFPTLVCGECRLVCAQRAELKGRSHQDLSSRRRVPLGLTAPHSHQKRRRIPEGSAVLTQMSRWRIGGRRFLKLKRLKCGTIPAVALPQGSRCCRGPDSSPPRLTRHRSRQFQALARLSVQDILQNSQVLPGSEMED